MSGLLRSSSLVPSIGGIHLLSYPISHEVRSKLVVTIVSAVYCADYVRHVSLADLQI